MANRDIAKKIVKLLTDNQEANKKFRRQILKVVGNLEKRIEALEQPALFTDLLGKPMYLSPKVKDFGKKFEKLKRKRK